MFWRPTKEEAELDSVVRTSAKPAIAYRVVKATSRSIHITETHFGGEPYAEVGDAWPALNGVPCDFVCQFNLADCLERPLLPFKLITVFLCWTAWEEGQTDACVVRAYKYPSPSKAVTLNRPTSSDEETYRTALCRAEPHTLITYPSPVGTFLRTPEIARIAKGLGDPHKAYRKSLTRLAWKSEFGTQLFGYPSWIQCDSLDDDDLIFVAQVGSETEANLMFGDAGVLFIAVRADGGEFVTDLWQCF